MAKLPQQISATERTCCSRDDIDFEALCTIEETLSSEGSVASDSDETTVSDFDELGEVSNGEVSFSNHSQPPSPSLLEKPVHYYNRLVEATDDTTYTECMDTVELSESTYFCNEDNKTYSNCNNMNSASTINQGLLHSVYQQTADCAIAESLPSSEKSQHVPGPREQAKKPSDDDAGSEDNSMSLNNLSDEEWSEITFPSPLFLQAVDNGPNHPTSMISIHSTVAPPSANSTTTTAEYCMAQPNSKHVSTEMDFETCDSTQAHMTSAFDLLEDYDVALFEEDAIFMDAKSTSLRQRCEDSCACVNGSCHVTAAQRDEKSGAIIERGVASQRPVCEPCSCDDDGLLTCEVTDDDFCWESEY